VASQLEPWCAADGTIARGFVAVFGSGGSLADDADSDGVDASQACCACGGGNTDGQPIVRQCVGRTTAETSMSCACGSSCHTCQLDNRLQPIDGGCTVCKNGQLLSDGSCITEGACEAAGGTALGSGNFNRKCLPPQSATCVGRTTESGKACKCPADCHTCEGLTCTLCKNKAVLIAGTCDSGAACVATGGSPVGNGRFGWVCTEASDPTEAAATTTTTTTTIEAAATTKAVAATTTSCPQDLVEHFASPKQGIRLKGALQLVLANGASVAQSNAECAVRCVAAGSSCKAFELKARGGVLRCQLMSESSKTRSIVLSAKWDLYDRLDFCGSD
jgi:hypothetical protein